jgi:isopentenyl-diphosphate delta-isomerase
MSKEELLDIVDENDNEVGIRQPIKDCLKYGLLHRAVTVFITNSKNQIFLQKRSRLDAWYPGYWTASCTGHVSAGETYVDAGTRELREELNLQCNLTELFKFRLPNLRYHDMIESEYMCVFEGFSNEVFRPNPDEIEDGKFVTLEQLTKLLGTNSQTFTPDAVLSTQRYLNQKRQ